MASVCESIDLGEFVVGEIPAPLTYQFKTSAGVAIDLSGYTAKFKVQERWGAASELNATVSDAANGKVTRAWDGSEFPSPGEYSAMFWVGNGVNRFASVLITWVTRASVGSVPTV